jgi:hypothetical protein
MVNWAEVARLVVADRRHRALSQGDYGQTLGLTQGDVSKLETQGFRRLTVKLSEALTGRFQSIFIGESPSPPHGERRFWREPLSMAV